MEQQSQTYLLKAKLKINPIGQIFSQVAKNIKDIEYFIIICKLDKFKFCFSDQSKTMDVQVILRKQYFENIHYNFSSNNTIVKKFHLKDFVDIQYFFDNVSISIELTLTQESLQLSYKTATGKSVFKVSAVQLHFQDEENIDKIIDISQQHEPKEVQVVNNSKKSLKLLIKKLSILDDMIHCLKLMKIQQIRFVYNSTNKVLCITPGSNDMINKLILEIQVEQLYLGLMTQFKYSFKKFKAGLKLISKDSPLILELYEKYMLIDIQQKSKKNITIKIFALVDDY